MMFLDGFDDVLLFDNGAGQRFFAIDVLAAPQGLGGDQFVPVIRHGQHDGVNVVARHHFAVIVAGLAVLVFIKLVDFVDGALQMAPVQIAGGNHLAVLGVQKLIGVVRPLPAPADHAEVDAVGRPRAIAHPDGAAGNKNRQRQRRSGGDNEATAIHAAPGG